MRLLPLIAMTTAVTLSACSARHEVITTTDQKPAQSIDPVSIIDPSDIIGRSVDSELLTMERFQFSEDGKQNLLHYKAWEYGDENQLEYQRVIVLSDTDSGKIYRQYDPDKVFERQHLKYLSGFLGDHFFIYGRSYDDAWPEESSEHPAAILHVHSLSDPGQVQRYAGQYGGILSNDRFLLGEYALDWRTGETFPAKGNTRNNGSLTHNNWFYFGERSGHVHRFHITEQKLESWSSDLFAPRPKPTADENYIVALDSDGKCVAWRVTKKRSIGRCTQSESGTNPHRHLSMHPEDNVFVLASENSAFLYRLEPFGIVTEFDLEKPIYHVGVTPKERLVITTEDDIQVWDLNARALVAQRPYRSPRFDRMSSDWGSAAFQYISDDGELLAVKEENSDGELFIGIYRIP